MKKRLGGMAMVLLFACVFPAFGAEYLYFRGFIDQETREIAEAAPINAWNLKTNELFSLDFYGYLIESDIENGVLAVLQAQGGEHRDIQIARCAGGAIQETFEVNLPGDVIRIYAKYGDWIYYACIESNGEQGVYRINADGWRQSYAIPDDLAQEIDLEDWYFSISREGCLAFVSQELMSTADSDFPFGDMVDRIYLSYPDGETVPIEGIMGKRCVWLDASKLFYVTTENELYVYQLDSGDSEPVQLIDKTHLSLQNPPQSNLCISSDGALVAWQVLNPEPLFGFLPPIDMNWNSLAVISLETGEMELSPHVLIATEISYD